MTPRGRPKSVREVRECEGCGSDFQVTTASARRYCSKACSNRATAQSRIITRMTCPCGTEIQRFTEDGGRTYQFKKYCSPACLAKYQARTGRKRDPENYITFNCEKCGKEVIRYKKLNGFRFCSNECASKSNHAVHHVIDRETSTVLDSGWEALLWGLCRFLKIPIERIDRSDAIEWSPGHWYAPDFLINTIYVEVKGLEDDEDPGRWNKWKTQRGLLVVLDKSKLDCIRCCESKEEVIDMLDLWAGLSLGKP